MAEFTFLYKPPNDFQNYNIICKEIPSQIINNNNDSYVQSNDIYEFYYIQLDSKKIYKVTCRRMASYNEQQQREFSEKDKINLRLHLENDLTLYLAPTQVYAQNYCLSPSQDYYAYENMLSSYEYTPFESFFITQQNNRYTVGGFPNGDEDYVQGNYTAKYFPK